MWKITAVLTVCLSIAFAQDCTWSINVDVPDGETTGSQPLYIRNNGLYDIRGFWLPKVGGDVVTVPNGDTVLFSCTGRAFETGPSGVDANLTCAGGSSWLDASTGSTYSFSSIKCTGEAWHDARIAATNRCPGAPTVQEMEIGFQVDLNGQFYTIINTCFDTVSYNSIFAVHKQVPEISGYQSGFPRPNNFEQGTFYPSGMDVDQLYSETSQSAAVQQATGQASSYYLGGDYFMSRGHLGAKADFIYGSHQRASFWFLNVAPQWQTFNGGNWNSLEQDMRSYVQTQVNDFFVYTGTSDILRLKDTSGIKQEIYLDYNNKYLKGAGIYWRVIYDPVRQLATGFIGLNNPHADPADEAAFFSICPSICDQLTNWPMSWQGNDLYLGFQYCADISCMRSKIPEIPTNFVVTGILN